MNLCGERSKRYVSCRARSNVNEGIHYCFFTISGAAVGMDRQVEISSSDEERVSSVYLESGRLEPC